MRNNKSLYSDIEREERADENDMNKLFMSM